MNINKFPATTFRLARRLNYTHSTIINQHQHSPPFIEFILQRVKMAVVNPTPLVHHCCGYCCKAEEYGNHENCGWCEATDVWISSIISISPNVHGAVAVSNLLRNTNSRSPSVSEMTPNLKIIVPSIRYPERAIDACGLVSYWTGVFSWNL
jgi:hypothetical protein